MDSRRGPIAYAKDVEVGSLIDVGSIEGSVVEACCRAELARVLLVPGEHSTLHVEVARLSRNLRAIDEDDLTLRVSSKMARLDILLDAGAVANKLVAPIEVACDRRGRTARRACLRLELRILTRLRRLGLIGRLLLLLGILGRPIILLVGLLSGARAAEELHER